MKVRIKWVHIEIEVFRLLLHSELFVGMFKVCDMVKISEEFTFAFSVIMSICMIWQPEGE